MEWNEICSGNKPFSAKSYPHTEWLAFLPHHIIMSKHLAMGHNGVIDDMVNWFCFLHLVLLLRFGLNI